MTMNELFPPKKLRTHKGKFANPVQFKDDESERDKSTIIKQAYKIKSLENALELERRKQPAWYDYRKYTELKDKFDRILKVRNEEIKQLNEILNNLKR